MTRRGRSTLLVLAVLAAFSLGYAGRGVLLRVSQEVEPLLGLAASMTRMVSTDVLRSRSEPHCAAPSPGAVSGPLEPCTADDGLPDVAAGIPAPTLDSLPPAAPDALFRRLPVGIHDYESGLRVERGLDPAAASRFVETVTLPELGIGAALALRVEYTFDAELTQRVVRVLERGRVRRGHVIVLDPHSGRVLAYVSTDVERFPPDHDYPAASLVKVVTASAALQHAPDVAREPCVYRGNQYRLTRSRLHPPKSGHSSSLERALATSNNQCFAQLAVNAVGSRALLSAIAAFGWLEPPAPGHSAGSVDMGDDDYDLGRLGCGLSGCRITPLHAVQLAASLVHGMRVSPWWVDRVVDASGRELLLPKNLEPRPVMSQKLASELREMLVRTTTRGTARSAFRTRRGRPKLGPIRVAGKTGNLSGTDPKGRYEWFIGVAPASAPTVAIAVLQVQDNLWWSKSSQIGADVLVEVFCDRGKCDPGFAARYTGDLGQSVTPILLSDSERR